MGALTRLYLGWSRLTELQFSGGDSSSLETFSADTDDISQLILDDAIVTDGSFAAILSQVTAIAGASLVRTNLGDTRNLSRLLGFELLQTLTVDTMLYATWQGDLDGGVDEDDVAILAGNYGGPAGFASGDTNGDGIINAADLSILAGDLDGVATPLIPEPATLMMLSVGATALLTRRAWTHPSHGPIGNSRI